MEGFKAKILNKIICLQNPSDVVLFEKIKYLHFPFKPNISNFDKTHYVTPDATVTWLHIVL